MAVWYMDDGSNGIGNGRRKNCNLATNSFSEEEVCKLLSLIKEMGFTDSGMYKQGKGHVINIKSKSILNFIDFVKASLPDMPDCMKYKVDTSEWKVSWKDSPNYHPQSVLNDELVAKIMLDARQKLKQREIAKKHGIDYKLVNSLLRNKLIYKSEFGKVNYSSTTGVEGVTFNKKRNRYISHIALHHPDGRLLNQCLGYYKDKETATLVANESRRMRNEGVVDPAEYKKMKERYKNPVNRKCNLPKGVSKCGNRYVAYYGRKWRCYFSTLAEAIEARRLAEKKHIISYP